MSSTKTSRLPSPCLPGRQLALRGLLAGLAALAFSAAEAITGGVPVNDAEFAAETPWVVVVASREGNGLCTGVLVSPRFVLTAGHCSGGRLEVFFGSPSRAAARRVGVREAIVHPQYTREPLEYDLGLLRLVRPVRVAPVAIASRAESWDLLRPHREATILGWGSIVSRGEKPDVLRRAGVLFSKIGIAGTHFSYWSERGGPCGGDSGGPMLLRGQDGVSVLVGIASTTGGNLCEAGGGSAAYTNVSVLLDFIRRHVPDLRERLPPLEFNTPGT
ncbi:MAG: trypsin-like serine protease [Gammaproteobacteria bacterium]|nr:trypsin-like serine protease [Gammaproteobacteria bacterium]